MEIRDRGKVIRCHTRSTHRWHLSSAFTFKKLRWQPRSPTCGLRISDSPSSDKLTPQETTKQDAPEVGPDGVGLSCPGSSVVADRE